MNARSFKVIFSKRLGALVAVGENATAQGKSASGEATHSASGLAGATSSTAQHMGVLKHICLAALLGSSTQAFALDAAALPTGAELRHGAATVGTEGATMTINQSTSRATINWQSFNVGSDARVNVVQNNSQSVLLNRVVGNEMSQIRGQISANGQVVLVNPNGIVMGPTGRITASAFTASTFGISDANFEAGHMKYERNGSNGKVVHQGHIQTAEAGGYVALIGAEVSNEGTIKTRQGAVVLAAAERVSLPSASDMNSVSVPLSRSVRLEIDPAAFGSASVSNSGVIQTEGGQVLLRAAAVVDAVSKVAAAKVTHTGSIDTTGEQGGRVDILADKGHVRVSGNVKANSTDGTAGGAVFIGRDEHTNVLAAIGDASGATLESQGGFVETSGSFLATYGTRVKAKDWLLDPFNITIAAGAATGTNYETWTPGADSIILASDIAESLNDGTNVTIATGLAGSLGTSDGNIIVDAAIVKSGNETATLTLIANNGITVNHRIGKAVGDTTSTGQLNVNMTAHGGVVTNGAQALANPANSQGIVLNNVIDANGGTVMLTGTSQSSAAGAGVRLANSSGITAGSYTINGTKLGTTGNGYGVWFTGTSTLTSSGNSLINGTSDGATGAFTAGLMFDDSTTVTLDAGAGSLVAKGSNAAYQTGVRIAANGNNSTRVTTRGTVTLGSNDSTNAGFVLRSGTLTADSGKLTILGKTNSNQHGVSLHDSTARIASNNGASIAIRGSALANDWNGVTINGASINAGTGDLLVNGSATNGNGVYVASAVNLSGRDITIDGSATTTTSGIGVRLFRNSTLNINASRNLAITGTVNGTGTGNGIHTGGGSVGSAVLMTAGETATLKGIQRGNANNTSSAVYLSGLRVNATGDVTIQAEAASSNSLAIHMNREAGSLNEYQKNPITGAYILNAQGGWIPIGDWSMQIASSAGDVRIQSNQGAILGQDINGGVRISGKNVMLDNTGGSINSTTGAIALGNGTSTYSAPVANDWSGTWVPLGVSLSGQNSTARVNATNNLTIGGSSSATRGLVVGNAMTVGGNINLAGRSTSSNALEVNAALTSTGGDITLSGDRMNIGSIVKVANKTVTVKTVSAGNKIDIGSGSGVSGVDAAGTLGLSQAELNRISAGNLVIGDAANTGGITVSAATTTNASTGNLTLLTGGDIAIDGALTVGDSSATKNLTLNGASTSSSTVSQSATAAIKAAGLELLGNNATHTLNATGNDIKKLAGNTQRVSLTNNVAFAIETVNSEGLTSVDTTLNSTAAVTQTQAIRTSGLELLGNGGHYTLNHADNTIKKLAGDTGSVSLTNKGDLYISTVDSVDGLRGTGTVSITTTAVPADAAVSADAIPGDLILRKNLNAANVNLNAAGAVLRDEAALATDGILQATSLLRIKAGSNIGTSDSRIQTNVTTLSMESRGNQFVTEANAVTVAARTSNNGSIDIATTDGTLTVGSSTLIDGTTAINGITAHGSGNITLAGTSSVGLGISAQNQSITSTDGNVSLTGKTAATATQESGIWLVNSTVNGKNVTVTADATGTTGSSLGYRAFNSHLTATEKLEITGTSLGDGTNNGVFLNQGSLTSGTGMTITGTASNANNSAVGLTGGVTLTNGSSGGISITGTGKENAAAINLSGSTMTNGASGSTEGVKLTALNGNIVFDGATNTITNHDSGEVVLSAMPSLDTTTGADHKGAIDGTRLTITQTGAGGVQLLTSGTGDITAPKMVLNGGNVVIAAGTAVAQGDGGGGQVKTVAGNNITGAARTYIHTGSATGTGPLSNLGVFGNDLFLSTIGSDTQNAASNRRYQQGPIQGGPGGANAQVMFREKVALNGVQLNNATITYGDGTNAPDKLSNLQTANPVNAAVLASNSTAGTFRITKTALMSDVASASVATALGDAANLSTSGHLKASTTGYAMDVTGNNYNLSGVAVNLIVDQKVATITGTPTNLTFNGTQQTQAQPLVSTDVLTGDVITPNGGVATGTAVGTYNNPLGTPTGADAGNYNWTLVNADLVIAAATPTPEPRPPVVPVVPPTNPNVVVTVAAANNNFVLAGAEGQCSADTLEQCECETATDTAGAAIDGIQICYEPKGRATGAPL